MKKIRGISKREKAYAWPLSGASGFSLVETLVTLGVASIMMLAIMQIVTISSKQNRNVMWAFEQNNLVSNLRHILNDANACTAALGGGGGQPFFTGAVGTAYNWPADTTLNFGSGVSFVVNPTAPNPGVVVTAMSINVTPPGTPLGGTQTQYLAAISITTQKFERRDDTGVVASLGAPKTDNLVFSIVEDTAINVAGRIATCGGAMDEAALCAMMGGAYNAAPPAGTPRCVYTRFGVVTDHANWAAQVSSLPVAGGGETWMSGDLFLASSTKGLIFRNAPGVAPRDIAYMAIGRPGTGDGAAELTVAGVDLAGVDANRLITFKAGRGSRFTGPLLINSPAAAGNPYGIGPGVSLRVAGGGLALDTNQAIMLGNTGTLDPASSRIVALPSSPPYLRITGAYAAGGAVATDARTIIQSGGDLQIQGPTTITDPSQPLTGYSESFVINRDSARHLTLMTRRVGPSSQSLFVFNGGSIVNSDQHPRISSSTSNQYRLSIMSGAQVIGIASMITLDGGTVADPTLKRVTITGSTTIQAATGNGNVPHGCQTVYTSFNNVSATPTPPVNANCPANRIAISGGVRCSGPGVVMTSRPSSPPATGAGTFIDNNTGWSGVCSGVGTITVYATCCSI